MQAKEEDDIEHHGDNYWIREEGYLLLALNSSVSFTKVVLKMFLVVEGGSSYFHVADSKGATLCYAVVRTGPQEIMYRKI